MAQFSELWTGFTDYGALITTAWETFVSSGSSVFYHPSTCAMRISISSTTRQMVAKTGVSGTADADCCIVYFAHPITGTSFPGGAGIRGSGTSSGNFNAYIANLLADGVTLRISKYVAGTLSGLAEVTLGSALSFPYFIRIRAEGTNLMAKAWNVGAVEPSWQVTTADASLSSGRAGPVAVNAGEYIFGPVAVGTGGDTPPNLNFALSGTVFEDDTPDPVPVERVLCAMPRANPHKAVYRKVSGVDGSYQIPVFSNDEHVVFALDDVSGSFNALIADRVTPVAVV